MTTTQIANQIRKFLKSENINAPVKVMRDIIVIDNLGYGWAQNIAEAATGQRFEYITPSMTRLVK